MKKKLIKLFVCSTFLIVTFIYTIKWLDKINIKLDDEVLKKLVINSSNLNSENKIINNLVISITNSSYIDPVEVILKKYSTKYIDKNGNDEKVNSVSNNNNNNSNSGDANTGVNNEPIVYIYNTHQTEKYNNENLININYTVIDASLLLEKKLEKYGITSLVEKGSVPDVLNANNWSYANSYKVSRMFLESAKKNHSSLKYFIDLHRDSVNKGISTVQLNGKSYARTLFVLGLENPNYAENEKTFKKLENWLNSKYPGLSRGIFERKGSGVNGVYNQDFSSNCILIEVGGEENTTEEVANTIEVIAEMLNYYIREEA